MLDNVFVIRTQSQVKSLGNELKLSIIRNLITEELTCQQLSDRLKMSKQKVHYNLRGLLEQDLIDQVNNSNNNKEKHYRAKARNYVIDFSLGNESSSFSENGNREMIRKIMEENHGLDLQRIASSIVRDSICIQPGERMMVVTGRFNLPLVELIQISGSSIGAEVNILYRDQAYLNSKNEEFSLEAYRRDYENFKAKLSSSNVYLYLNGESRYLSSSNAKKRELQKQYQLESLSIIREKGIRVVMMPGLLKDSLQESNIRREIGFWKALDVDYRRLRAETDELISQINTSSELQFSRRGVKFSMIISSIMGEYGSFGDSPYQSGTINLPGGEVLLLPKRGSINGTIRGDIAYVKGIMIKKPEVEIRQNKIVRYKAEKNEALLTEAIQEGGEDGSEIALICLGTNYNIQSDCSDLQHLNKSKGLLTVYWGNNTMLGGDVQGKLEWQLQIRNVKITKGE